MSLGAVHRWSDVDAACAPTLWEQEYMVSLTPSRAIDLRGVGTTTTLGTHLAESKEILRDTVGVCR